MIAIYIYDKVMYLRATDITKFHVDKFPNTSIRVSAVKGFRNFNMVIEITFQLKGYNC